MRRNIHYKPSKGMSVFSGVIACAMGVFGLFTIPSIGAMIGFKAIWCLMTFGMGIYNFLLAAGVVVALLACVLEKLGRVEEKLDKLLEEKEREG